MAIIVRSLAAGTLTLTGTADLYTVPASKSAVVSSVRLVNGAGATTPSLNLYVKASGAGTAYRIEKKDFTLTSGAMKVVEDVITLAQGDKIQINYPGPSSPSLAYTIHGVERI